MKAETLEPKHIRSEEALRRARIITRTVMDKALSDICHEASLTCAPGDTLSMTTCLCLMLDHAVSMMTVIDRDAAHQLLLAIAQGVGADGIDEDLSEQMARAQDRMTSRELSMFARMSSEGTA